jgi:GTP-binding protein
MREPTVQVAPNAEMPRAPLNRVIDADFVAGATKATGLPAPALAEIAFAGRSNVGKSSLLNTMMQRKSLARTSGTPGCTRQINAFSIKLDDGLALQLIDLPGYGYAKVSKKEKADWGPMLEGYLLERPTLRALVLLVDVRRGLEDDDVQLLDFLSSPQATARNKPVERIVVATKLDKLPLSQRKPVLARLQNASGVKCLGFSSVTGDGRDELWARLRASL